jgi:hypothetical protein
MARVATIPSPATAAAAASASATPARTWPLSSAARSWRRAETISERATAVPGLPLQRWFDVNLDWQLMTLTTVGVNLRSGAVS